MPFQLKFVQEIPFQQANFPTQLLIGTAYLKKIRQQIEYKKSILPRGSKWTKLFVCLFIPTYFEICKQGWIEPTSVDYFTGLYTKETFLPSFIIDQKRLALAYNTSVFIITIKSFGLQIGRVSILKNTYEPPMISTIIISYIFNPTFGFK